ncbi:pentatricopeptide repeat-containing protein, partial [Tanacetum coccineum]
GLESVSIRRIQCIGYGVLGFLRVGTTFDIFQNIHILYLQYGVLVFIGYGVLIKFPLWSLVYCEEGEVLVKGYDLEARTRSGSRLYTVVLGFLSVWTVDIFQYIEILYLEYGLLSLSGYDVDHYYKERVKRGLEGDDRYAVSNESGYAVLIYWDEYAVLNRELDTTYPMEVDTPHGYTVSSLMDTTYWSSEYIARNGDDDVLDILGLDSSILGMKVYYEEGKVLVKGYDLESRTRYYEVSGQYSQVGKKFSIPGQISSLERGVSLGLPDFDQEFIIETDASGTGIGIVFCQKGHPLAYLSKTLTTKHQGLSTYEKEFMAVIVYKKGVDNGAADALSRVNQGAELLQIVVSSVASDVMDKVKASWMGDDTMQQLIKSLKDHSYKGDKLALDGDLLKEKGRIMVGNDVDLKKKLIAYFHEGAVGGHSGVLKPDLSAYPGLLQPLPIPERIWAEVSMDFIKKLPNSQGKTIIMVTVDMLSKYAHFMPLSHPFNASQVAQVFLDGVYRLHGLPESIVSDRDKSDGQTEVSREEAINMLKFHMKRAQDRMRSQADKHKTDKKFVVGTWVYMKLQPHRQATCHGRDQQMGSLPQLREDGLLGYKPMAILERRLGKLEDKLNLKEDGVDTCQLLKLESQQFRKSQTKKSKFVDNGLVKALDVYKCMRRHGVGPVSFTFTALLKGCGDRVYGGCLGEQIHGVVMRVGGFGLGLDVYVGNGLIDMYVRCGELGDARKVFDEMCVRDLISWTTLIVAYTRVGDMGEAGVLFEGLGVKDMVVWTAMVMGFAQNGKPREALEWFDKMVEAGVEVDEVTLACVISACGQLGATKYAKWIRGVADKAGFGAANNVVIGSALIDMYAKCGCIEEARNVFDAMREKNVYSYSSLILGYAMHGCAQEAIALFERLVKTDIKPNKVTFLGVLSACSHAGLVEQGRNFFAAMEKDYGVPRVADHYTCMVDLLGRAGLIEEAYDVIKTMPITPHAGVWGALLGACRVYGKPDIAEIAATHLFELEPNAIGNYILLSNTYASARKWNDVSRIRALFRSKGIKKNPASSWVEGAKGAIHEFFAGDMTHPRTSEIKKELEDLLCKLMLDGYSPVLSSVPYDVSDDEKKRILSGHSEKLALAYGLLVDCGTIRITKNVRICEDCHVVMCGASKITGREIIVRDNMRFHHFRDGVCSCNNFW